MSRDPAAGEPLRYGIVLPNWVVGPDVGALVDLAVEAEGAGWDGVFLADHLIFPPPSGIGEPSTATTFLDLRDPWITMTAIAVRTERIALGSWITPLPRRQPWQFARDVATLDRLSNGRVLVGIGLGRRPDYEKFGGPWDLKKLGRRCEEALEVVDGLWGGEPITYRGEHYTVDDAAVLPTPQQRPRPPFVIGGMWPKKAFLRRGARWDGIVPHFPGDGIHEEEGVPEEEVQALLEHYHGLADDPGEIMLPLAPPGCSAEYPEICKELGATWLYSNEVLVDLPKLKRLVEDGPPRR